MSFNSLHAITLSRQSRYSAQNVAGLTCISDQGTWTYLLLAVIFYLFPFLQYVSIASYARHTVLNYLSKSVLLTVRLSVTRWYCVKMTRATIMWSSLDSIVSFW